jgi:threonine dehydrogenase-like Zn-dependent dehydrogenase
MRALVLKDFGKFEIEERTTASPGHGEVQLRIIATGICGSDIHGFTGKTGRRRPGQIMGHESVGRIAAVGEGTADPRLKVGALATFNPVVIPDAHAKEYSGREHLSPAKRVIGVDPEYVSAFAQFILVPARNVIPLPDSMPWQYGALIEPIAVAVHAARRVGIAKGDRVLVVGGGPIGQSIVLAARRAGAARIAVSEPDPARRALCASLGAIVLETDERPITDRVTDALGALADVSLDAVGISASVRDALLSTVIGGTVGLVGMGSPELALDAFRVSTEERTIVGSFTYSDADFRSAAEWVAAAPSELASLISKIVPLDRAQEAFEGLARMDGTPGKILVQLSDNEPVMVGGKL